MFIKSLNLLFVHIPKTGGESVVHALAPQGLLGPKHVTYREFRLSYPEWNAGRPTVACFVRNPWDQVLSFYSHLRKPGYLEKSQISQYEEYFADGRHLHPLEASRSACELDFSQWVGLWYQQRRHHARLSRLEAWPRLRRWFRPIPAAPEGFYAFYREGADKYLLPYLEWMSGPWGHVRADFIGRFEDLENDFQRLASRLGIVTDLPHLNRSRHDGYRDHYDLKTRQLVAEYYAPEILRFGYQF